MATALPDDLAGLVVTVDAGLSRSASQGFADELVKQVLEVRHAASLTVSESPPALSRYILDSAAARGFSSHVSVDARRG